MAKKKRCATGYNLFLKSCSKETGDFKGCLMDKGWKNKLSDKEREKWNDTAKEQCDV